MWSWNSMLVTHDTSERTYIYEMGHGIGNKFYGNGREGYRLHFVIAGSGVYNGTRVCAGQFFLSFPTKQEEYTPDPDDPWEYFWFSILGSDAERLLTSCGVHTPIGTIRNFDKVLHFYRHIYLNDFQEITTQQYAQACLHLLLSYIRTENTQNQVSVVDYHVNRARLFIDAHFDCNISMSDIANFVNIDERYLYNIFKQKIGMAPKQYLVSKRFRTACDLLEHTDLSIAAVGTAVGFSNALYFSSFFKKQSGISPSQYRKKSRHI